MRPVPLLVLAVLPLAGCAAPRALPPAARPADTQAATKAQAVIDAVQRVFDAMAARDSTALRLAFAPGATLAAIDSTGTAEVFPVGPWAARIAYAPMPVVERMVAPRVEIEGQMATLWAFYTLHLGERFLHCGTDAAVLVRKDEAWKVQYLAFTMRPTGCPAALPRR